MKKFILYLLFALIVAGDLIGEVFRIKELDYLFKPLIMVWIGGYFYFNSRNVDRKVISLTVFAFIFSWFGDVFLMFGDSGFLYFVSGLVSFLCAQIIYIFVYKRTIEISGKSPFLKSKPYFLLSYIIYGIAIYSILFNSLDTILKFAVFIYMLALLGMSAMALNRKGNSRPQSFYYVFLGSVLFVLSDSMIAINKFLTAIPNEGILIMTTYIAAQFLIMQGILKEFE